MTHEDCQDLLLVTKLMRNDIHLLSGVSRPTINKFLAGEPVNESCTRVLNNLFRVIRVAEERDLFPVPRRRGEAGAQRARDLKQVLRGVVLALKEEAAAKKAPAEPQQPDEDIEE